MPLAMRANTAAVFWSRVDRRGPGECWPWTGFRQPKGYGRLSWNGHGRAAHRLAWELTHGPIPDGLHACHTCDNPPCCNPTHLFLGTIADNNGDALAKGRRIVPLKRGSTNGQARLTEAQVGEIRSLRGVVPQRALAARFGVSDATVCRAQTGVNWSHV